MRLALRKNIIWYIILSLFFVLSILYIEPSTEKEKTLYSKYLSQKVIKQGNCETIQYVNENGDITNAADLGYSQKTISYTSTEIKEAYFDSAGNPVCCNAGYHAILKEYERGLPVFITYLDIDEKPMMLANGYASEKLSYDGNNRVSLIVFYDTLHECVCSVSEGYAKKIEYNEEGKISRITYIDQLGNPMISGNGYAIASRLYIVDERTKKIAELEFYYDSKEQPIKSSFGQYGVKKEYNEYGELSKLTYVDEHGEPIVSTKGYTTVTWGYIGEYYYMYYYDLDGKPYKLPEGQYGTKTRNKETVYLDAEGNEQLNLKRFLHNHSIYSIFFSIACIIISARSSRIINAFLMAFYIVIIIYITLLYRERNTMSNNKMFTEYLQIFSNAEMRADIIKNIWLFIPLGAVLYQIQKKKQMLFIPIILSLAIESVQKIYNVGLFEVDDIISNTIGGGIGFLASILTTDLQGRINLRRHIHNI